MSAATFRRREQETPYDDETSRHWFRKQLVLTRGVLELFGTDTVVRCVAELRELAAQHRGLQYLQVYENAGGPNLWIIEDAQVVTALLASEY